MNQASWNLRYLGWIFRIFSGEGEIGADEFLQQIRDLYEAMAISNLMIMK